MAAISTWRLFFAALPDAATLARVTAAADALRLDLDSRRVPGDNFHVTLAFLGAIAQSEVAVVRDIGRAQRTAAFTLRLEDYEHWPRARAIVASARVAPPALESLWASLHRELAVHGWALDPLPYRPHVTLAKKVSQAPVLQAMSPFLWPVREFCLMRSESSARGSVYTVLDTWPLLYESAET